jgi:hypothetical protein
MRNHIATGGGSTAGWFRNHTRSWAWGRGGDAGEVEERDIDDVVVDKTCEPSKTAR